MKKISSFIIVMSICCSNFYAQTISSSLPACNNEDFESSLGGVITSSLAVSGWTVNRLTSTTSICNSTALAAPSATYNHPLNDYVELFDAPGGITDPLIGTTYTIFSVFGSGAPNPGSNLTSGIGNMYGNKLIRVHKKDTNAMIHHTIEKTISVTASNSLFRFAYLPVVEPSSGGCCAQPGVYIRFLNVTGGGSTLLPCPAYSITAQSAQCPNPIAMTMSAIPNSIAKYHQWRVHAVDLSPYIGSDIKFKIANMNCQMGCLHFGYVYLDAQCSPMQIYVNDQPFPAHTNSVSFTGCGVNSATVVAPPDFSSYQWNGPAAFSSTLSTITTSVAGIYTLNIMASGTCSTITKYVNIQLLPAASVSVSSSPSVSCAGSQATLIASGLVSYTWEPSGGGATKLVTPTVTTTYTVSGANATGCSASAILTHSVNACVGINEINKNGDFVLYPNPNSGIFTVDVKNSEDHFNLFIYNILGEILSYYPLKPGKNVISTDITRTGVYFYEIKAGTRLARRGIIAVE